MCHRANSSVLCYSPRTMCMDRPRLARDFGSDDGSGNLAEHFALVAKYRTPTCRKSLFDKLD